MEGAVLTEAITTHFELQISTEAIYPAAAENFRKLCNMLLLGCYVVFINMKL